MRKLRIVVRRTHFAVTANVSHAALINQFNSHLITYQTVYIPHIRKMMHTEDRRYYYKVGNGTYHYSIHLLTTFIKRCISMGYTKKNLIVEKDDNYEPGELTSHVQSKYEDRDHQPVYIKKAIETNPIVLVDLKTGKGKTYISMRVADEMKYPTGIVVLSRYINKWINDIKELTTATDDDIYVVRGKDSLTKLIASDVKYDFVIFSLSTLRRYIKAYDDSSGAINIAPEQLFKHLGLGMMLNDEVHQSFHASYMVTIRLNPFKVISLSATLDNLDKNITFMYGTLYPDDACCGNLVEFKAHPIVVAANYFIDQPILLRYVGPRGYSHTLFEQSALRYSIFRNMYLELILYYVNKSYIARKRKGDKLLILVQTIKMATLLTNYLRSKLKGITINRYVEEDPYENIMDSDIAVSTNQSAGTALDIPNLITVIQTVSIRSLQTNIQALGRLREIKGVDVMYYYIYSSNISNQHDLHNIRKSVIRPLAKEYRFEEYPKRLKCR